MSRHVKGRKSTRPAIVPDVRELECPEASLPGFPAGNHELWTGADNVTVCCHCKVGWIDLDAQVRANLTPTSTGTKDCIDCGATLVSDRRWAEAASEIRQQWRDEGKASRVGDRCARCSRKGKAA